MRAGCSVAVYLQISLACGRRIYLAGDALPWTPLDPASYALKDRTRGETAARPPLHLDTLSVWSGDCEDLNGLWQPCVGGTEGLAVGLGGSSMAVRAPPCCRRGAGPEALGLGSYPLAAGPHPPGACPRWHSPAGARSLFRAAGGSRYP